VVVADDEMLMLDKPLVRHMQLDLEYPLKDKMNFRLINQIKFTSIIGSLAVCEIKFADGRSILDLNGCVLIS
jgi:hypothetical protein